MFGDDRVALGSLDETDSTDAERRPVGVRPRFRAAGSRQPGRSHRRRGRAMTTSSRPSPPSPSRRGRRRPVSAGRGGARRPGAAPPAEDALSATPRRCRRPWARRPAPGRAAVAGAGAAGGIGGGRTPGRRDRRARDPFGSGATPADEELFEIDEARPTGASPGRPRPTQRAAAGPDAGQAPRRRRCGHRRARWPPSRRGHR